LSHAQAVHNFSSTGLDAGAGAGTGAGAGAGLAQAVKNGSATTINAKQTLPAIINNLVFFTLNLLEKYYPAQ